MHCAKCSLIPMARFYLAAVEKNRGLRDKIWAWKAWPVKCWGVEPGSEARPEVASFPVFGEGVWPGSEARGITPVDSIATTASVCKDLD